MVKNRTRKILLLLFSLLLILGTAVGGTVALLTSATKPAVNTFSPASLKCEVVETDAGYTVINRSNISAYVRVAVVPNWTRDGMVYALSPISPDDYRITATGWTLLDEYYYYLVPLAPNESTPPILAELLTAPPDGCRFSLEVLAEAIQSEPVTAVSEAWGFPVG
ncbi:MAG: hypothetical protein IJF49_08050 [Clostridia bacterium]|nr:hypothetical protein [Clostridia bacterium]